MDDNQIKIPFNPAGPDWIWSKFIEQIVDPLIKEERIKLHDAELKPGQSSAYAEVSVFQNNEWVRHGMGAPIRTIIAKIGQEKGLPIIIEDDEIYFIMSEQDAIIEYLKYGT
jgi:hypothetical protein